MRNALASKRDKYIAVLLRELAKLEAETDPKHGPASTKDKDRKAFIALNLAGKLVRAAAEWAIDHQVGLAREGLSFVPSGPSQLKNVPEYLAARAAVDDHKHEA